MDSGIVAAIIAGVCSIIVAFIALFNRQNKTERRLERVSEVQVLLAAIVTGDEARHLHLLKDRNGASYENHRGVRVELRSLVGRGLIKKVKPGLVHELPKSFTLTEEFEITALGGVLLRLREQNRIVDAVGVGYEDPQAA